MERLQGECRIGGEDEGGEVEEGEGGEEEEGGGGEEEGRGGEEEGGGLIET